MMNKPQWLPDLVLMEYYNSFNDYIEALYQYYIEDFIINKPSYKNIELSIKRQPKENGKDATFWHLIKFNDNENVDFRRAERIKWPSPICYFAHKNDSIKVWENIRKNETRILIWYEEIEYLVVLAKRIGYTLFWTAYPVSNNHTKRKLEREYQSYIKANSAP